MFRATFYFNIYDRDGKLINEDFDWDECEFESEEDFEDYCQSCGYEIGECCGYFGDNEMILMRIVRDDEYDKEYFAL